MSSDHESPIKTPKQLATVVALAFVLPIIVIMLLVAFVNSQKRTGSGADAASAKATQERIRPVAQLDLRDANAPKVLKVGEEVYKAQCSACHSVGAAGAPKFGDASAWAPRIKTGYEALVTSALKGKNAMSAQGGGDYDDTEIARAVVYMTNAAGAKFSEPKVATAPAAVAPASSAPVAPTPAPVVAAPTNTPAPNAAVAVAATAAVSAVASTAVATKATVADKGKAIYDQACTACHAAGAAGAPKFGDKAAWAPRIGAGVDALTASVIKGKGAMPPRGASVNASDADIKATVEYMLAAAK